MQTFILPATKVEDDMSVIRRLINSNVAPVSSCFLDLCWFAKLSSTMCKKLAILSHLNPTVRVRVRVRVRYHRTLNIISNLHFATVPSHVVECLVEL